MRPIRLDVENFLGIERVDYEFEPGIFVMVGENGSGKSSFFEAIHFALFGFGIRFGRRSVKPYIRRGSSRAVVDFTFERGGKIYRIVRVITSSRSRSEIYEVIDGRSRPISEDPNEFVTDLLGMDPDVFQTVFLIPQGRITDIMDKIGDLRGMIMRITGFDEKKKALMEVLRDMRRDLERSSASIEYENLVRFLEISPSVDDLNLEIEKVSSNLNEIRSRLKDLTVEIDSLRRTASFDEKLMEISKLETERDSLKERANYEEIAEKIREIFPMIDRIDDLKQKVKSLSEDLRRLELRRRKTEENVKRSSESLRSIEKELASYDEKLENLEMEVNSISSILEKSEGYLSRIGEIRSDMSSLNKNLESLKKSLKDYGKKIQEDSNTLEKLKDKLEKVSKEYEKLKRDELNFLAEKISERLEIGDICPVCGGVFRGRERTGSSFDENKLRDLEREKEKLVVEIGKKEERLRVLNSEVSLRLKEKEALEKSYKELEEELEKLKTILKSVGYEDGIEDLKKRKEGEMYRLRKERDGKLREVQSKREEVLRLEKDLEGLKSLMEEKRRQLSSVNEEIEELSNRIESTCNSAGVDISEVRFYREYLGGDARVRLREVNAKIESLRSVVGDVDFEEVEKAKERLKELEKEYSNLEKEERDLEERLVKLKVEKKDISEKLKRLKELEEVMERENERLELVRFIHSSLSADKFDEYLFHRMIPSVVERASLRLKNVTEGKFSLKIVSNRGKEELMVLNSSGEPLDYRSLSGGERTMVALVMALSLSEVLSGGVELFFIDEGFSALDVGNRESVVDMLNNLEESGKTVIFITHLEDLAAKFERSIRMRKGRIVS